jgi:hypothetical protein
MTIIDLNRYQKTYPFLRFKPNFQQQGSTPAEPSINNDSLFATDGIDIIYKDITTVVSIPDPFILITSPTTTDIVMPNAYADSIRDTFFNVDNLIGDIILDY